MNFSDHYFTRYKAVPALFNDSPDKHLGIVVTIPCYDEEFIFNTLDSLESAEGIYPAIEVIVVVNSGENSPPEVVERNRLVFSRLKKRASENYYKSFKLLPFLLEGVKKKKAGVGFARKTAMDEAVRRYAETGKPEGMMVSLDADTLVDRQYFKVVEHLYKNADFECFTLGFQHDFDRLKYPENVINACKLYEIYLRYYRLSLKTFDFPFAIHTIGSCFAIRAEAYIKIGGMPVRQGGEDFYFLQKAAKKHPVYEVKERIVFPSPRISHRVPFGTGPSVAKITSAERYCVYNPKLFVLLKQFYGLFPSLEKNDMEKEIPPEMMHFTGPNAFYSLVEECRKYSSSRKAFIKRMYDKFDAFFVVKFLNSFDKNSAFPPVDIQEAGKALLHSYGINKITDLYEQILFLDEEQ